VQAAPHAHNFVTELWVETGVPGLAVGLAFFLFTLWRATNLNEELRPFALGGWMAAIVVSLVGFNLWTDALWAAFALSAFVFGGLQRREQVGT
jgi:O-antigen ligase